MSTALAGKTLKVEVAGDWAPFAYECTAERVADKSDAWAAKFNMGQFETVPLWCRRNPSCRGQASLVLRAVLVHGKHR